MSRNFGIGSRVMRDAGCMVLRASVVKKQMSFSTAGTNSERWSQFCGWAKKHGVKKMEHITSALVKSYGLELADQVRAGNISPSTGQNYVSSINTVMKMVTQWTSISPTRDCGVPRRSHVRADAPGALDRARYQESLIQIRQKLGDRAGAVVELARDLGLRTKEASLLNARAALAEARKTGSVTISEGTKGGRKRSFDVSARQLETLGAAAKAQGDARAVMAPETDWKTWRQKHLKDARKLVQQGTGGNLHDLRTAYACERYKELTKHDAPCTGGRIENRAIDHEVRRIISAELGHGRIDVVSAYVGSRGSK